MRTWRSATQKPRRWSRSDESGLDQSQAILVAEMAKLQENTTGGTSDYLVTREFRDHSTMESADHGAARVLPDLRGDDIDQRHGRAPRSRNRDRARAIARDAAAVGPNSQAKLSARFGFGTPS